MFLVLNQTYAPVSWSILTDTGAINNQTLQPCAYVQVALPAGSTQVQLTIGGELQGNLNTTDCAVYGENGISPASLQQ